MVGAGGPPPLALRPSGGPVPLSAAPSGAVGHRRCARACSPPPGPSRWPPSPSGAPARCPPGLRLPPPVGRGAGARAGPRPGPLPRPVGAALARRSAAGVPPARLAAAPGGAGSGGLARAAWACPAGRFGLPVRSPSALSGLAPACGPAPASVGPPSPARRLRAAASGLAPPRRGPWSARPLRGRFVWRSRPPALLALPRRCGVAVVPSPRRLGAGAPCRQRSDLPPLLACPPHVLHINEASTYPAPAPEKVEQNIFYFVQFSPFIFAPLPGGSNAEDDLNKIPVVVQFFPTGPLLPLPTPSVDSARYTPPVR